MKAIPIALAASLLLTSGAAVAQNASDARCVILTNAYAAQAKETNAQKLAEASFYFYLGRLGSQASAAQLKALFDQQAKTLSEATAGGQMNDCVKEFRAKVELIQSLGSPAPATTPKPATPPKK